MQTKWIIEEINQNSPNLVIEEGGEVVLDKTAQNGGTTWQIQSASSSAKTKITFGGEIDGENSQLKVGNQNDDQDSYSILADKFITRIAVSLVLFGILSVVLTVCICVLVVICNDIYRNTLTSKDLLPLVTTFLQTAVTILMGILVFGQKRKNGG